MSSVRFWLSMVLALLLPLEAATAIAMPCRHLTESVEQQVAGSDDGGMSEHDRMDGGVEAGAGPHDPTGLHPVYAPAHAHAHALACGLCGACCSAAALAFAWPVELEWVSSPAEAYAVPVLPAASFLVEGQERPPRSC